MKSFRFVQLPRISTIVSAPYLAEKPGRATSSMLAVRFVYVPLMAGSWSPISQPAISPTSSQEPIRLSVLRSLMYA